MENAKKQQKTKKKLADAFMELYAKKDINRIPIKAITDRAGLNRATFYIYYEDVYDLRDQIETYFLEKMGEIINRLEFMDIDRLFQEFLTLYKTTGNYLPILLGKEGSPFPNRIKTVMRRRIRSVNPHLPLTPRIEYAMEYQASGIIGVFGQLLRFDPSFTPEQAAHLIHDISAQGVAAIIREERKEHR
jgi:AcrR family transcriptional regulator